MRHSTINALALATMFLSGSVHSASAADVPSGEAGANRTAGIITDRLDRKQLQTWRAMEQVVLARNSAGQPLHPVLYRLFSWAKASSLPIHIEMTKAEGRYDYVGGRCVFDRQPKTLGGRLAAVTIRLCTTVIDKASGHRIPGEQGFVAYQGLTGEKRYCEALAHELAHVRQAVTDPEFLQLADRQKSLNDEILRLLPLRLLPGRRQSVTKEMRAIADRLNVLSERIEGPAVAVEQEVWHELAASRTPSVAGMVFPSLEAVSAGQSSSQDPRDEVPFELRNGYLVVVQGSLPGVDRKVNLLIDTGTTDTFVDRKLAKRAGLRELPDLRIRSAAFGRDLKVKRVVVRDLQLGSRVISRSCLAADLPLNNIDVVIGLDILGRSSFTIDYENSKLVFEDQPVAGPKVPFRNEEGLLIVPVSMSGETIRLAIDTGAHLTAVYAGAVKSLDKRALDEKLVKVAHSAGTASGRQITLPTVQLGATELDRLPIVLLQAKKPGSVDGFLGTASLGLARLHLDFGNQVLSLVQK